MQIKPRHFLRVLSSRDGHQEAGESKVLTKNTIAITLGNFELILVSSQKTWECVKKLSNQVDKKDQKVRLFFWRVIKANIFLITLLPMLFLRNFPNHFPTIIIISPEKVLHGCNLGKTWWGV